MRYALLAAALLSPFLFPYPATLALSFAASCFFPPAGIAAGALTDFLYYLPGTPLWPVATLLGILASVAGFFVRRFIKARIIGG